MMILTTDKDFADAVKRGQKIKKQTVYYTGKLENVKHLKIGDFVEGKGIYAGVLYDENGENPKPLILALNDWRKKKNWDTAMKSTPEGWRVPNRIEWLIILENKDKINAALEKHGGKKLSEDDWYWSSSEYSSGNAWEVHANNGNVYYSTKYTNGYVRCVLA
jgi:hypothetical protein